MKRNRKNILITLGFVASTVLPVASVVACSTTKAETKVNTPVEGEIKLVFTDAQKKVLNDQNAFMGKRTGHTLSLNDYVKRLVVVGVENVEKQIARDKAMDRMKNPHYVPDANQILDNHENALITFEGRSGGANFDASTAFRGGTATEPTELVIGSNTYIGPGIDAKGKTYKGYEEQLIGMHIGDTRVITILFPTNYQATSLAGKEAFFKVTLTGIKTTPSKY